MDYNLLDIIGELHDTAVEYADYSNECSDEEIKVMLKDMINRCIELHDIIFENINLEEI